MLLEQPLVYYKAILRDFAQSYFAEDERQAIIGIDCEYFDGGRRGIGALREYFGACKKDGYPPYAGLFGVMSYDAVYTIERLGTPKEGLYEFPNYFYANARAYLHYDKRSKIYSFHGDSAIYERLRGVRASDFHDLASWRESGAAHRCEICTNLEDEKAHFLGMVERAKEYLRAGDAFQIVVGELLDVATDVPSLLFYECLRERNPSPYMFHFPTPYGDVVGSSPEVVFEMIDDEIFVAPFAGTRPRGRDASEDERLRADLLADHKELCEHRMLIDLARNDISKFARPLSVRVKNPVQVVFYESVMHIISEVYGKKDAGADAFDVFSVIFPAGTLSGTPKIRAMQIINELERTRRGIYGGGIGFWRFNGDVVMAILIRSAIFARGHAYIGAGAGIVLGSRPEMEYAEICNKRKSCLNAILALCGGEK